MLQFNKFLSYLLKFYRFCLLFRSDFSYINLLSKIQNYVKMFFLYFCVFCMFQMLILTKITCMKYFSVLSFAFWNKLQKINIIYVKQFYSSNNVFEIKHFFSKVSCTQLSYSLRQQATTSMIIKFINFVLT